MLVAAFLDWFSFSEAGFSFGENGLGEPGSIWSILAILLALILAAIVIATRLGNVNMPDLPENTTWGLVFGGGAALIIVFMLLKAWRIMDLPAGGFGIGFFLALIAAIAIAVGGYLLYTEEKRGVLNR